MDPRRNSDHQTRDYVIMTEKLERVSDLLPKLELKDHEKYLIKELLSQARRVFKNSLTEYSYNKCGKIGGGYAHSCEEAWPVILELQFKILTFNQEDYDKATAHEKNMRLNEITDEELQESIVDYSIRDQFEQDLIRDREQYEEELAGNTSNPIPSTSRNLSLTTAFETITTAAASSNLTLMDGDHDDLIDPTLEKDGDVGHYNDNSDDNSGDE